MYYITKKDSETGKKLQEVINKIKEANSAAKEAAKGLGANEEIIRDGWFLAGGIKGVVLPNGTNNPALRLDTKSINRDVYVPNLKRKEGKELKVRLSKLPVVDKSELNEVVGFDNPFSNIGYNYGNDDYFAFSILEDWNINMPDDCEEITTNRYKEMFKQ